MACNCIDDVNAKLATRNTCLTQAIVFNKVGRENNPDLMLRTEQIETGRGKQKAVSMFLTFCPFCGIEYDTKDTAHVVVEPMSDLIQDGN